METTKTILSSGFNPPKEWIDKIINEGVKVKDILFRVHEVEQINEIKNDGIKFSENDYKIILWLKHIHKSGLKSNKP